jgi:hypothetical protein
LVFVCCMNLCEHLSKKRTVCVCQTVHGVGCRDLCMKLRENVNDGSNHQVKERKAIE